MERAPQPPPPLKVQTLRGNLPPGASVPTRIVRREAVGDGLNAPLEVCTQAYMDRTLVIVTQRGKIGTLVQATTLSDSSLPLLEGSLDPDAPIRPPPGPRDPNEAAAIPTPLASTALTPLLGAAPEGSEALYGLYASTLAAALVAEGDVRPLVLSLSLLPLGEEGETNGLEAARLKHIVEMVREARVW